MNEEYKNKPVVYPMTKGLLCSMAMRADHSFGLDRHPDDVMDCGHTPETRAALLKEVVALYKGIKEGNDENKQITEEAIGKGFYSPKADRKYAEMWPKEADFLLV